MELSNHPVVGQRSEAAIMAAFIARGFAVLIPWGTNQRYDIVLDVCDRFLRVQCKTGRLRNGAIEFRLQSVRCNTKQIVIRNYIGEIEYFASIARRRRASTWSVATRPREAHHASCPARC